MRVARCIMAWVGLAVLTIGVAQYSGAVAAIVAGTIVFAEAKWG